MLDLYLRRPRLLVLTVLLVVAAGWSALQQLPRTEDPELVPRFATVLSAYPGATAERVEALVTDKIEDELRGLPEMKEISSDSRAGMAVLQLELRDEVPAAAVATVWSRVRDKLADAGASMPAEASAPELVDDRSKAYTILAALRWDAAGPADRAQLARWGDALADALRAAPGTGVVHLFGRPQEEVLVELAPGRLADLGLEVGAVAERVRERDAKRPAGALRGRRSDLAVEVSGEPDALAAVRDIPVAAGADGRLVRLGEVAEARKTVLDPAGELALSDGRQAVVAAARMLEGRRVDEWAEGARARLGAFEAGLPLGLQLELIFDQSRYVERRFGDLWGNLLLGTGLVLLVTLVMMGWRASLLVGVALPLTTMMVFAEMQAFGIPLHQISVSGLILALGLLIDNAIIVVDEVRHELAQGRGRGEAMRRAVRLLAVPLFGSTATTVLAFLPIALMPGPSGEFVGSIAWTVAMALVSSLALSLTVIAALTARFAGPAGPRPAGLAPGALGRGYRRALRLLLGRPWLALALATLLPAFGFRVAATLPEQFFPPAERDQLQVQLFLPAGSSLAETRRTAGRAEELLREHSRVVGVDWFLGTSAPMFYYNMVGGRDGDAAFAQALVRLDAPDGGDAVIRDLQRALDAGLPQTRPLALQLEQGPPFEAPVELRVYGPDLDRLERLGERLRLILSEVPRVTHTRQSLRHGEPKLLFRADEAELRMAGRSQAGLARSLQAALEGVVGGSLLEQTEELPIRVRLAAEHRDEPARLASLELPVEGGRVPLRALGRFERVSAWGSIPHRDGDRLTTAQGFLEAGTLPALALADFRRRIEASGFELPPGYRIEFGGESAERDEAVGGLLGEVGILMVLMAAALVLSFQSFRAAGIIGLVAALAAGLAFAALWAAGLPFGFMAILGLLGLIGLAINDSIVVMA